MSSRRQRRLRRQALAAAAMTDPLTGRQVFPTNPSTPRYRIKRGGEVIEIFARATNRGWALREVDQPFAQAIAEEIERACEHFHLEDVSYTFNLEFDTLPDDEVIERVKRLDQGEHKRESALRRKKRFPLQDLPLDWKRALIANLERIALEWGFEKVSNQPSADSQVARKGGER